MLCAGHQGSSEEGGMTSALRALPVSLLCNNSQAGSRPSPRHPSLPSTAGLPPPSLSPTWHLAPLPCPDIPSGFCVSPARCTDGLPPFTPAFSCQPRNSAPLRSPVSQAGEEGTQESRSYEGNKQPEVGSGMLVGRHVRGTPRSSHPGGHTRSSPASYRAVSYIEK